MNGLAMVKRMAIGLVVAMVVPFPIGKTASAQTPLPELVQRVKPSVAFVQVGAQGGVTCGSAFVVDASGILVTAAHVVEDAETSITVQFPGRDAVPAEVLAVNIQNDVAILRVSQQDLTPLPLADINAIKQGDDAILVGYPLCTNPDPTVARGIVSGMNRTTILSGAQAIQLDIAMTHGESGGPVMTTAGEVIGVVDSARPDPLSVQGIGQGLNYAIPSSTVRLLLATALDSAKPHSTIDLPLKAIAPQSVFYKNTANANLKQSTDVACTTPPERALSMLAVHGTLKSAAALNILIWLSPKDNPSVRVDVLGPREGSKDVDFRRDYQVEPPPRAMCVNFAAQSGINCWASWIGCLIPLGFEVTYIVDYKMWSPTVLASQ